MQELCAWSVRLAVGYGAVLSMQCRDISERPRSDGLLDVRIGLLLPIVRSNCVVDVHELRERRILSGERELMHELRRRKIRGYHRLFGMRDLRSRVIHDVGRERVRSLRGGYVPGKQRVIELRDVFNGALLRGRRTDLRELCRWNLPDDPWVGKLR